MALLKYLKAQEIYIDTAKSELKKGAKQTHWIWFIFPQLKGLGKSFVSEYYGLHGLEETKEYYSNKSLRKNLLDCFKLVMKYEDTEQLQTVFGMLDAIKVRSCATLFYIATKRLIFKKFLDKFFDGFLDEKTVVLLEKR